MGSLKDALKAWKARGRAEAESRQKAEEFVKAASKSGVKVTIPRKSASSSLAARADQPDVVLLEANPQKKPTVDFRTSGIRPLGKEENFKMPDEWVDAGGQLQPPGQGEGRILTVRIGIDFGTAYTKVAISAAQSVFFVDWAGVSRAKESLFLPGIVSVLGGEAAFVGRTSGARRYMSDLKLPFLPTQVSDRDSLIAAAVFLAWVMRYARGWFFHHQAALCKGRKIAWEVNIGSPTKAAGDKSKLDLYEYVGHAAWRISVAREIGVPAARKAFEGLERPFESEGLDVLSVFPEFVAQIAGYVRSSQRRRGLHLLVDCGAGTVDVVTFNVHKNKEEDAERYPIFASAVEPLGAHFLMAKRATVIGAGLWDDSERIPSRGELAGVFPERLAELDEVDLAFQRHLTRVTQGVIDRTRAKRTPLALAWDEGVPLFVTGGGASSSVYCDAVSATSTRSKASFLKIVLPKPAGAKDIGDEAYHRLSVAYGLTFDKDSLGRVIPEEEIDDFSHPQPSDRLDRDDLYPK